MRTALLTRQEQHHYEKGDRGGEHCSPSSARGQVREASSAVSLSCRSRRLRVPFFIIVEHPTGVLITASFNIL